MTTRLLGVLLCLALLTVVAIAIWHEFRVDRCLDAGGHWNADQRACEGTRVEG